MNIRANIIAVIHFLWIIFAIVCLPLVFIIDFWSKISLVFVLITMLSWFVFKGCLFLQLENRYRSKALNSSDLGESSFIQFYLKKMFNIQVTRTSVRICIYSYMAVLGFLSLYFIYF